MGEAANLGMERINRDIHVLRYFSSFVSVSEGRVIYVSQPKIDFCPLAAHFYAGLRAVVGDKEELRRKIKEVIEFKIREYGFFTADRRFDFPDPSVPYGASEMLMWALRRRAVEAAVVVCDGAGTVIAESPDIVQGIGARMHNLIITSPIPRTMKQLVCRGCRMVFDSALIDQFQGVIKAAELGHKKIAVTIDGYAAKDLERLKGIEEKYGVKIISLIVCTTGVDKDTIGKIMRYADLVWSCSSQELRRLIGPFARLQLSKLMPVFAISEAGEELACGWRGKEGVYRGADHVCG